MRVSASRPANWSETGTSTDDTAQTISHAAETGVTHYLCGFSASADATASFTANIEDDDAVIHLSYVYDTVTVTFDPPREIARGNKVDLELGAAGTGIATVGSIWGYSA